MLFVVLIFAAFGAMLRYASRTSPRPWLVSVIFAAASVAVWLVSFLMEVDGLTMAGLVLACAAGSCVCALLLRWRARRTG